VRVHIRNKLPPYCCVRHPQQRRDHGLRVLLRVLRPKLKGDLFHPLERFSLLCWREIAADEICLKDERFLLGFRKSTNDPRLGMLQERRAVMAVEDVAMLVDRDRVALAIGF